MYSTIDGAKKRANTLFRAFEDGGIIFPLHRCQEAIARAGGFETWHQLIGTLRQTPVISNRDAFRRRLMKALPPPCRQPALAWMVKLPRKPYDLHELPPYWGYDVGHYVMEALGSYRRNQPIIRIGSGPGQRLREALVMERLMNTHDGTGPRLDPDTCALIYRGPLAQLFEGSFNKPRFETEFNTLVKAGIFDWTPGQSPCRPGTLKLLPSPGVDPTDDIAEFYGFKSGQWFERSEYADSAISSLWEGLASLGIDDGERIATAIVSQGAAGYLSESGQVLELLSDHAANGELETLARTVSLFAAMHPKNGEFVRRSVPAKVGSLYFAGYRRISATQLVAWGNRNPQWPETVIAALGRPANFSAAIDAMVAEIESMAS